MAVNRRIDGPTPNGGVYSVAYYSKDGQPAERDVATEVEYCEFDAADNCIFRTYGRLSPQATTANAKPAP